MAKIFGNKDPKQILQDKVKEILRKKLGQIEDEERRIDYQNNLSKIESSFGLTKGARFDKTKFEECLAELLRLEAEIDNDIESRGSYEELEKVPFRGKTGIEVKEVEDILKKIEDGRKQEREIEEYRKRQEKLKEKPSYEVDWIRRPKAISEENWLKFVEKESEKFKDETGLRNFLNTHIEAGHISERDADRIWAKRIGLLEKLGIKKPLLEKRIGIPKGPIEVVGTPIRITEPQKYKGKIPDFKRLEEMIERLKNDPNLTPDANSLLQQAKDNINESKRYLTKEADVINSLKYYNIAEKQVEKAKSLIWRTSKKENLKKTGGWLLHRGPEEFKIPRAIAYGKRELDRRARGINKEALIKPGRERIKKEKENLKIDEYKKTFDEKNRKIAPKETEKNKIEAKIEELYKELEGIKSWDPTSKSAESERIGKLLRKHENELNNLNRELISLRQEAEKSRQDVLNATKQLNQVIKDYWKPKLPILKDMLKNEVLKPNGVLEKACNRYKIEDISGKTEVKDSLLEFADALAGHMINNNFKTFYQGAGWFGKVATGGSAWGSSLDFLLDNIKGIAIGILIGAIIGGLLGGAGGAAVGGVIGLMLGLDLTRGFIEGFMFGPIVIGVILAYVAYLFTTAYVTAGIWGLGGPNILLVIITIVLTVLLGMGEVWGKKV